MDKLPDETITPDRLHLGTDEITVLATSAQSGGALCAVEVSMQPGGGPPLMHRHDPGEVYHVLRGEFAFYVGSDDGRVRRVTAGTGDVVPLAGRTPHTIRNESDSEAVAFVVHAPGPPMEGFIREAAALAAESGSSMEAVLAIATRHGIEMLGPVPELAPSEPSHAHSARWPLPGCSCLATSS
jgi:mannose-6-phosphate isomerase-like protein (cupin superfamily)